jgi:uncharacterized membrane protein
MLSKARLAGRPIHPMVVVFPIALYATTVAALLAYFGTADAFYYRAAMMANLAGVAIAMLAMIPGAIDLRALPKPSRARTVGLRHAGFALAVTGAFAASGALLYRNWEARAWVGGRWELDATVPLAIGVIGLVLLVMAAALGWALVQTSHVGIEPGLVHVHRPSREPALDAMEHVVTPIARAKSAHTRIH